MSGFIINPEPIKVVPKAVRDVWTKQPGWRCYYEDGRGRCTSRATKPYEHLLGEPWYCDRHAPKVS